MLIANNHFFLHHAESVMKISIYFPQNTQQTIGAWRVIFFVTIALYVIEIVVYTLFGSGDEQPWNRSQARELVSVGSTKTIGENAPLKGRDSRTDE